MAIFVGYIKASSSDSLDSSSFWISSFNALSKLPVSSSSEARLFSVAKGI
jgi:hypothetical protein